MQMGNLYCQFTGRRAEVSQQIEDPELAIEESGLLLTL